MSEDEIINQVTYLTKKIWPFILKESYCIHKDHWDEVVINSVFNVIFNLIKKTYPNERYLNVDDHVDHYFKWINHHMKIHGDDIKEIIRLKNN